VNQFVHSGGLRHLFDIFVSGILGRRGNPVCLGVMVWALMGFSVVSAQSLKMTTSTQTIDMEIGEIKNLTFSIQDKAGLQRFLNVQDELLVQFKIDYSGVIKKIPTSIMRDVKDLNITLSAIGPGIISITPNTTSLTIDTSQSLVRVVVKWSEILYVINYVIGWGYILAWSFSLYPQILYLCKQKTAVGLAIEMKVLQFIGFCLYGFYNISLGLLKPVKREYLSAHPRSIIPIYLCDVVYTIHAAIASALTIGLAWYFKGAERISYICWAIVAVVISSIFVLLVLYLNEIITILDFISICSWFEVAVTVLKYIPQLRLICHRKQTGGFPISAVLLELLGGCLSVSEMIIDAFNFDDFDSLYGDITKFLCGILSIIFMILFILCHYVFYGESASNEPGEGAGGEGEELGDE